MAYHNNGIMVGDINELMKYWDYDKNFQNDLDPNMIPVNSYRLAFWKCESGHQWKEKVSVMYRRKTKCFFCAGRSLLPGENDLKILHPDIAALWDYDKNSITPDKVLPNEKNKYWWKCENGHPSFLRRIDHMVARHNTCPYCSGRKAISGVNDLQTLYPDIAAEWDYSGNGEVLPSEISPETWKAYKWICPKGHHYSMKVHLRTHSIKSIDCPKCVKAHSTSFPEQAVYYYAKQFYPDAINRYKGISKTGLELDIYIPSWNVGIEYDGKAFHSSEEAKTREKQKYEICKKKDITLIRIREGEPSDYLSSSADEVYYIKKRISDSEMNAFLIFFFTQLTTLSHSHFAWFENKQTGERKIGFSLPVDINIKRDRPKILEYLIDVDNSFGTLYPDLAKNWDDINNEKLTPYMFTPGSNYMASFKCERCGEKWSSRIHTVVKLKRTMCRKCSMTVNGINNTSRIVKKRGSLGSLYEELIKEWDQETNGSLTPFDVPKNYSKKVFWKCPVCEYKWSQAPNARIHKNSIAGCPHCAGRVAMPGVDDLETLYPEIVKEWDYEKNKGVLPSQLRPHSNEKRYWICSKHNISYMTSPSNRLNHTGCPICRGEKIRTKKGFKVEQYNKSLEYITTFSSLNEAGRVLNTSPEAIRQAIINGALSMNCYWKYEGTEFKTLKQDRKHPVVAIHVKTGERLEFESAREAERSMGIGHSKIMNCCKGVDCYNTAGGYYWHFKDQEPNFRKNKTTGKPVVGRNKSTNEIIEFESAREAERKTGVDHSKIMNCCKGKAKTAGGYYWVYKK